MSRLREEAAESAAAWLASAGDDLAIAERGLRPPALLALVCYHAEQAAEKAVKAHLAWLGEERIPRTHELDKLAALIDARGGTPPPDEMLTPLQPFATAARYPGGPVVTAATAEEALHLAREVVAHVRRSLGLEEGA